MSLAEKQAFLCRLYSDRTFRALFIADKKKVYSFYNLSDEDKSEVESISIDELVNFSNGVSAKNRSLLLSYYPLANKHFQRAFSTYLSRYLDLFHFSKYVTLSEHVLNLGDFIRLCFLGDELIPEYAQELVNYERTLFLAKVNFSENMKNNSEEDLKNLSAIANLLKQDAFSLDKIADFCLVQNYLVENFHYNFKDIVKKGTDNLSKGNFIFLFSGNKEKVYLINSATHKLLEMFVKVGSIYQILQQIDQDYPNPDHNKLVKNQLSQFLISHVLIPKRFY